MSTTIAFWGVRGSIPTPGAQTARYGGNTACVTVERGHGSLVILDAGSGLRPLGHELMLGGGAGALRVDLLLSHTHWDHIQGLPFFKPLSASGNAVTIYGAAQAGVHLEDILRRQMDPMVFPVPLTALAAAIHVTQITEGAFEIDGFRVNCIRLRHPGTTLGYRLADVSGGREIAYVTDNELGDGGNYAVGPEWRTRFVRWLDGVDTLIHDAMYHEQIVGARAGWGHSSPRQAIDLAAEAGVRCLILFHHEPEHDDSTLDGLLEEAVAYAKQVAPRLEVRAAMEGMRFTL